MKPVVIRYSDHAVNAAIEPCGTKMYRISKKKQQHLPRAERIKSILEVIAKEPGLSYRAIGRRVGLSGVRVYRLIKEENIKRI